MTAPTYPDIAAFLVAQLDRLEGLAKAATEGPWTPLQTSGRTWTVSVVAPNGYWVSDLAITTEADAAHIAQHDPAFVLRDIDAKRAIVAEYVRSRESTKIGEVSGQIAWADAAYLLAAPFADQPGYQQEWAVG